MWEETVDRSALERMKWQWAEDVLSEKYIPIQA
jgi:hypothetical protein